MGLWTGIIGPRTPAGRSFSRRNDPEKWGIGMKKTALAIAAFAALSGSAIAAALRVDIINVLAHFGSDPRINPRVGGLRATKLPQWRRNSAPVEQPL